MGGRARLGGLTRHQVLWQEIQNHPGITMRGLFLLVEAQGINKRHIDGALRRMWSQGRLEKVRDDHHMWQYWVVGDPPPDGRVSNASKASHEAYQRLLYGLARKKKEADNSERGRGASKKGPPRIPSLLELLGR